jgi:hypothetical protein
MGENEESLPKGMVMTKTAEKSQISVKDVDYGGILLRKISEITEIEFRLVDLQINEGANKAPTVSLVLQVLRKADK